MVSWNKPNWREHSQSLCSSYWESRVLPIHWGKRFFRRVNASFFLPLKWLCFSDNFFSRFFIPVGLICTDWYISDWSNIDINIYLDTHTCIAHFLLSLLFYSMILDGRIWYTAYISVPQWSNMLRIPGIMLAFRTLVFYCYTQNLSHNEYMMKPPN